VSDWFRAITALGVAFASVVIVTLGLAVAIVSTPADTPNVAGAGLRDPFPAVGEPQGAVAIPGLGGTLAVTGDRQGDLHLNHQAEP